MKVIKILSFLILALTSHLVLSNTELENSQQKKAQQEEAQLKVIGLFKDAALVNFNGKQKLYRNGQTLAKDIKLVKANTSLATFLIQGKTVELGIDSRANYSVFEDKQPKQQVDSKGNKSDPNKPKQAKIWLDGNHQYFTIGFINGKRVNFLVDTGATNIAMTQKSAEELGINYRIGQKTYGTIADGSKVGAWVIRLNKVRVGEIELNNIIANVLESSQKGHILLGMSFLSKLKMENDGRILTLTKKY